MEGFTNSKKSYCKLEIGTERLHCLAYVEEWVSSGVANTPEARERMKGLLLIRAVSGGIQF